MFLHAGQGISIVVIDKTMEKFRKVKAIDVIAGMKKIFIILTTENRIRLTVSVIILTDTQMYRFFNDFTNVNQITLTLEKLFLSISNYFIYKCNISKI
jgi:hypothetical protein